jgi:hypothetical protein
MEEQGPPLDYIEYDAFFGCSGVPCKFPRVRNKKRRGRQDLGIVGCKACQRPCERTNITEGKKAMRPIVQEQATHRPVPLSDGCSVVQNERERPCMPGNWNTLDPICQGQVLS